MQVLLHKNFVKKYKKLPTTLQKIFVERTQLLLTDPTNPMLKIHSLKGRLKSHKSMNITGDYRALFIIDEEDQTITFLNIGTHSSLYGS
jgi:addiction module RelE/StbE family toxin